LIFMGLAPLNKRNQKSQGDRERANANAIAGESYSPPLARLALGTYQRRLSIDAWASMAERLALQLRPR
jgi:hypothetical protein